MFSSTTWLLPIQLNDKNDSNNNYSDVILYKRQAYLFLAYFIAYAPLFCYLYSVHYWLYELWVNLID